MMPTKKITYLILLAISVAPASVWAKKDKETQAQLQSIEQRLGRLEALLENQVLMELLQTVEQVRSELQEIRSDVEQVTHDVEGIRKRQRDLYLDLDRRVNDLQIGGVAAKPAMPVTEPKAPAVDNNAKPKAAPVAEKKPAVAKPVAKKPAPRDPAKEKAAYQAAFKLLREGRYSDAINKFSMFIEKYPESRYAANAQYWLGEANYVSRNFQESLAQFQKVIDNYSSSSKIPDAMLKMGYTHYELKQWNEVREILNQVLQKYPTSSVAPLAEKRLLRLSQEGH